MATPVRLIVWLLTASLFSCGHATTNNKQVADNSLPNTSATDWSHSKLAEELVIGRNNAAKAHDSAIKSPCYFDEDKILSNSKLPDLINTLENSRLTIYGTTKAIPSFILDFLKCSQKGEFKIASPGEDWEPTDAILDESLPRRQLVFFEISDSIALMVHYTGGIGMSEHILIFKFNRKQVTDFWCGTVLADLKDEGGVVDYLKQNQHKTWGLNTNIIYF